MKIKTIIPYLLNVLVSVAVFAFLFHFREQVLERDAAEIGECAVKLLYDFGSPEQLDYQMYDLQQLTTDAVFRQLTIDNEERTLNTYLKFKSEPVTVHVIKSTSTYVLYSLETENVDSSRIFLFLFSVGANGKIEYVREVEGIDFLDYYS